jgi:hypothetical protein
MSPYSVTLLCACAGIAIAMGSANGSAQPSHVFFIP